MSSVTKPIMLNETGEQIVQKLTEVAESNKSYELLLNTKADKVDVSAPFNFKGTTTYAKLPTSGNKINDTYYCEDKLCRYTWNGEGWYQSSMNEVDYTDELAQMTKDITAIDSKLSSEIVDVKDNIQTYSNNSFEFKNSLYYSPAYGLVETANAKSTDMVLINGAKRLMARSFISNAGYALVFFDINKNILSDISILGSGSQKDYDIDLTNEAYSNAFYIVASNYGDTTIPSLKVFAKYDLDGIKATSEDAYLMTHYPNYKIGKYFNGFNYFDENQCEVLKGKRPLSNGVIVESETTETSLLLAVLPNTTYYMRVPNTDRSYICESNSKDFEVGKTFNFIAEGMGFNSPVRFTTSSDTNYILAYISTTDYDFEANKGDIILNVGEFSNNEIIKPQYVMGGNSSELNGANILIFGDSITDCCDFVIDENDCTKSYSFRNPSNSYYTPTEKIEYSMWAKILRDTQNCGEVRNYAHTGASYRTNTRESGLERQNLHYQIDVALNDISNPNGAFEVDNFTADIVIFALGTNDGIPNDSFESAMQVNSFNEDGVSINVDNVIGALSENKFCESARKAFLRIKKAFPMTQIYCVLPTQRAYDDVPLGTLHEELKKMAQRCGCIIIDACHESGITREFNVDKGIGTHLKDSIHPNEKGQNLLARCIIKALKSHYMSFDGMN